MFLSLHLRVEVGHPARPLGADVLRVIRHQLATAIAAARRTELREDAIELGRRAFAEKPAALVRRLAAWGASPRTPHATNGPNHP